MVLPEPVWRNYVSVQVERAELLDAPIHLRNTAKNDTIIEYPATHSWKEIR
jgi:hypothetical protein